MTTSYFTANAKIPVGSSYDTTKFILGDTLPDNTVELIPKLTNLEFSALKSQSLGSASYKIYNIDIMKLYLWDGSAWGIINDATAGSLATNTSAGHFIIDVSSTAPPTIGQVLTAISPTKAIWQTPASSGGTTITIGSPANGLSIVSSQLFLALASSTTTGALSNTDWNTFNNKQNALSNPVTFTGTPVIGQIAQWTGANTISGINTTGSGNVALATSPTFVTPILGSASATTINKVAITQPATLSTLTIQDGFTLTVSGNTNISGTSSGTNTGDITLGTSNGLSLTGQQISLGLSSFTTTGALSNTDYNTIFTQLPVRYVINDTDYTITGTNNQIFVISNITAARNIYLPPATTPGQTLLFIDESGKISETIPLLGHPNGTDTVNGQLYARFISPYNVVKIESNGSGKWTIEHTNIRNLSAGIIYHPTFTNNGNGSITIGNDGGYALFANVSGSGNAQVLSISGGTYTLSDGFTNYVIANYNNGSPILQVITDVTLINETTIIPLYTIYRQGNILHLTDWDTLGDALVNKIHKSIVKTQRYRVEPGSLALGEVTPNRYVTIGSGTVWIGAVSVALAAFNSSINTMQFAYHVSGVWNFANITQYNNSQYDNGTNLVNLSGATRYAVNFIYRSVGNDTEAFLVLGGGNYQLGDAQIAQPPANLPSLITSHAILVGRIIVQNGATVATQIDSAFNVLFTPQGITDHNSLANLQIAPNPTVGEYYHLSSSQATIATQAATSILDGYLLHTDWTTFNSKEPAISSGTTSQYWRGDKTWQNLISDVVTEGTTNLYFTEPRVLGTLLTGFTVGANSALTSTDSILNAFSKIQGQINNLQPLDADLTAIAGLTGTTGLLRKTAANTWSLDTNAYLTSNQNIALSGDVSGSGTTNISTTVNALKNVNLPTLSAGFLTYTGTIWAFDSNAYLTATSSLNAGNLTGTIPSTVLGNSSFYLGTTQVLLNQASGTLSVLTGITSIDGSTISIGPTTASTISIGTSTSPQTINIGTGSGTSTINIGNSSDTVNILGTLAYVNTTNLTVTDKLITLNKGGAAASGDGSGIEIEENSIITSYFKLGNTENSWTLKSPNKSGSIWLTPSSLGVSTEIVASSTVARTLTLPDSSGTFALISDLTSGYQPLDADLTAIAGLTGTTGLLRKTAANTWSLDTTAYGTGNVSTVSIVSANGFAGTVSNPSTTPAITLTTTINGLLQGNGTSLSAATTTGTGNVVLATAPSLTTPNIDSATATSISYTNGSTTTLTLTTTTTTANQVVDSIAITNARVIKYLIAVTSGTAYQASEILIVHDGTSPVMTEYAIILTGTSLATFDSDISGGNLRLLVTPVNAATTIKAIRDTIFV